MVAFKNAPIVASKCIPAKAPFSIEGLPGSTTSQVKTKDGQDAASAALVRVSNNLGYFSLIHIDPEFQRKAVTVDTLEEDPLNFKLGEIYDELPFRSHYPIYIQVHHNNPERLVLEHLLDNLAETVLGRHNLELKKNVTIDLLDHDADSHFRDRLGFFITDRNQFRQLTVSGAEAVKVLSGDKDTKVEKFNPSEFQDLLSFDNTLSAQQREEYLKFLVNNVKVYVAKPLNKVVEEDDEDNKKVLNFSGYAFVHGERILGLCAESEAVAESLLSYVIQQNKLSQFTLAAPLSHWAQLAAIPTTKSRQIYRRHTRAVPSNVKWNRIFAMNVGVNLF